MVWRQCLLTKRDDNGIRGNMFNFINNFIHNRSISVKVNGQFSDKTDIINGIPQGSVTTLFNIFINDITKALNGNEKVGETAALIATLFADDCAIWRTSRINSYIFKTMQSNLDRLHKWAVDWRIKFSETKTVFKLFSKKRTKTNNFTLKSGDNILPSVSEFKFLGVTFDAQLTFKAHYY